MDAELLHELANRQRTKLGKDREVLEPLRSSLLAFIQQRLKSKLFRREQRSVFLFPEKALELSRFGCRGGRAYAPEQLRFRKTLRRQLFQRQALTPGFLAKTLLNFWL